MSPSGLELLPQRGPARLVVEIRESEEGLVGIARVPADSPFRGPLLGGASAPAMLAVEMAAQTAAALEPTPSSAPGSEESGAGAPGSPRLLVGLRAVELHAERLDAEATFLCRARATSTSGPLRIYRFEVSSVSGELVAEGELSTFFEVASSPT